MKKSAVLFFAFALLTMSAFAQSIQEGINNLYADRDASARATFEKLIAANPNNLEAVYWLGQTFIEAGDVAGARKVYQQTLTTNGNAPIVIAGMGHVLLLEGKAAEARQQFETAISLSKGKKGNDPTVLNAIGRANVEVYSSKNPVGDLNYAVAKLSEAAQLAPNNPDILLNLGNAYRKLQNGGEAVQAYTKAGNYAPAFYRTALLYKTQNNWDIVLENLNKAIQADARFAPAYEQLYDYYLRYKQDFNTAEQYANKVISSSDPSVENDYLLAQTKFVQNNFTEAINTAKNIIAKTNNNPKARVYRLLGYSYLGAKDTATACQYVTEFFNKAKEDDIQATDYFMHADACGNNNPNLVMQDYIKAVKMDSVLSRQINIINEAVDRQQKAGNKLNVATLRLLSYQLRGTNASPTELISYIAVPYYQANAFTKADSVAKAYITSAPDSIYGYLWSARALSRLDSTMSQGLAIPQYEKLLEVAAKDKARFKSYGVEAGGYLAGYYNNEKKDKERAINYLQRALEFDPTNAAIQNNINILSKAPAAKPAATDTKVKQKDSGTKTKVKKGK
jgi:tetratricopeptide (TPR) repeat protein